MNYLCNKLWIFNNSFNYSVQATEDLGMLLAKLWTCYAKNFPCLMKILLTETNDHKTVTIMIV